MMIRLKKCLLVGTLISCLSQTLADTQECNLTDFDCQISPPRCIDGSRVGNGVIDCINGFDEGCPREYFVCHDNSACLEPRKFMDGIKDCPDGSDEPCRPEEFFCADKSMCIDRCKVQDGVEDCPDGSDERCTVFQFECLCGQPRCIDLNKFNNTKIDCLDGSDEPLTSDYYTGKHCTLERRRQMLTDRPTSYNHVVHCGHGERLACSDGANEICLIIQGKPQCACRPGYVRLRYTHGCFPTSGSLWASLKLSMPFKHLKEPQLGFQSDHCLPNQPNATCAGKNEVCFVTMGSHACDCKAGFVRHPKTQDCIALVDECSNSTLNDCDPRATCIDNPISYECLCKEGYLDISESPKTHPGRKCTPLVDECKDSRINDCDPNADCLDLPSGYTCRCKKGFHDVSPMAKQRPGRVCSYVKNECESHENNCSPFADCIDTPDSYICRCKVGYIDLSPNPIKRPGIVCQKIVNECSNLTLNDCDRQGAVCVDTMDSYVCQCKAGFVDRDPQRPGRICAKPRNPCLDPSFNDCDKQAICFAKQSGGYECSCPHGFIDLSSDKRKPGRHCKQLINECELGMHHCDPMAVCKDTAESYECECPNGWLDESDDPFGRPGRKCKRKENECLDPSKNTCASNAQCIDTDQGYLCHCQVGFIDVSLKYGKQPGRICQELKDECSTKQNDCSENADCIDTAEGYLCRCFDGFMDFSVNRKRAPGRTCIEAQFMMDSACSVDDPLSCNMSLLEVCLFVNGTYKCGCPHGVSRLPDGRCKVINECKEPRLNDCHANAECIDQPESYTCQCKPGFVDASITTLSLPGRICQPLVNECADPGKHFVSCDKNAICIDTDLSYSCRCLPGYVDVSEKYGELPGRRCTAAINECLDPRLHDCSENALCEDAKEGYTCRCREGYVDVSPDVPHFPGRACVQPKKVAIPLEILLNRTICDPDNPVACKGAETCTKINGYFLCHCPPYAQRFEDGVCKVFNACEDKRLNDCHADAVCSNILGSYLCQCKPGFIDISDDPFTKPGRRCKELVNECALPMANDCSPFAECIDTREGYLCSCKQGYIDVSSSFDLPAGRKCRNTTNECSLRTLNTCDDNADCVNLPEGYTCQCAAGYVDVSSSAQLPPGRVCTIQTYCPTQPTDLMFVLDGSGSIGSSVFRDEILRFLLEFVNLFHVSPDQTRVSIIQYSDQVRHELDFSETTNMADVERSIKEIQYLTGLTKTGLALQDMLETGFSEKRGARPIGSGVHRVAVVITDGRSQDIVTFAATEARRNAVLMFAIGVTDHASETELIEIAGSKERAFLVKDFAELDVRLRSLIQKAACPPVSVQKTESSECSRSKANSCDAGKNEICHEISESLFICDCPDGFDRHPETKICGGELCNPEMKTSCPEPEGCQKTPYGNYRCTCPSDHYRSRLTGSCVSAEEAIIEETVEVPVGCSVTDKTSCPKGEVCVKTPSGTNECQCSEGLKRSSKTGVCGVPGSCDPHTKSPCDERRREVCEKNDVDGNYACRCPKFAVRDPVTQVCLINECLARTHDCDPIATCIDTRDGYICQCPAGYLDLSRNPKKAGRVCSMKSIDHCANSKTKCSPNADCVNLADRFICQCRDGYIDFSPNPRQMPGLDCREKIDECKNSSLNTCSPDAVCIDTDEGYVCMCKPNYIDRYEFSNPGRFCQLAPSNNMCDPGNNDCDRNAECFAKGKKDFVCVCPSGFQDKSPNPLSRPGRVCVPYIPACDDPSLNDCDKEHASCTESNGGYSCACMTGYLDISPDPDKPGRLCKKLVDECLSGTHDCDSMGAVCEDTPDGYRCICAEGYLDISPDVQYKPGRVCKALINECLTNSHSCSPDADCHDTTESYTCTCRQGFRDASPDPVNLPGRTCVRLINECEKMESNDCSPNAICIDTLDSYRCHCKDGFMDKSADAVHKPGRICLPKKINECTLQQHDCSNNAVCIDEEEGFTCRCLNGFLDMSPNKIALPGRVCVREPQASDLSECSTKDINSCSVDKKEVCKIVEGRGQCTCPPRYERHPNNGACTVINECLFSELNDCSQNAECIDQLDGYKCQCKRQYKDVSPNRSKKPGRVCKLLINECEGDQQNDCHPDATCEDLEDGYLCRCKAGYVDISANANLPSGRACHKPIDECSDPSLNNCDNNAICLDDLFGYRCRCRQGYLDVSPVSSNPGRACKKIINECSSGENDCDPIATCLDTVDSYRCSCPNGTDDISPNPAFPGRVCRKLVDLCKTGMHDCDVNAKCRSTDNSFVCECHQGYMDRSPNPKRPGRFCVKLVNECEEGTAQCSQNAVCRDLQEGYTCECKPGYLDVSPVRFQPGRMCIVPDVCPANHDCSSAAVCEPYPDGSYTCRCVPGYADHSPPETPGRLCVRANECRDPQLNNCSRNAVCTKLTVGYRCSCLPGYLDRSPDPSFPGVICEAVPRLMSEPRNPCQDPSLNDCSNLGTCRSIDSPPGYTCACPENYIDASPDPANLPGRVCIAKIPICLSQRDCHKNAVCQEASDGGDYTCHCRDGYTDQSPDPRKPGRICVGKINECLDSNLNDCAATAICEDTDTGYNCFCPNGYIDQSPNPEKPGRTCTKLINECAIPAMNNCSRFAHCTDEDLGYTCECQEGYFDLDIERPGTSCVLIVNECDSYHLNDCDQRAICIDLVGGYTCTCPPPYKDFSPDPRKPGRVCRANECESSHLNDCDPNAICKDTDDFYFCYCKEGYVDVSPNPNEPGRRCEIAEPAIGRTRSPITIPIELTPCGYKFCNKTLKEYCVAGVRCDCPPDHVRPSDKEMCQQAISFHFPMKVNRRNQNLLVWSSAYGDPEDVRYKEIVALFQKGVSEVIEDTPLAKVYIMPKVESILPPRLFNATWVHGLVFNYSVFFHPSDDMVADFVWNHTMDAIRRANYTLGRTNLTVDPYEINYYARKPPTPEGTPCGDNYCNVGLGEVCLGDSLCTCPYGEGRKEVDHQCKPLVSYWLPLLVARRANVPLKYYKALDDPTDAAYRELSDLFTMGIKQAYRITVMWPVFISVVVTDILDASKFSWSNEKTAAGLLFNFTVHFEKGDVGSRQVAWEELFNSCVSTNYSLGGTDLYLDPLQPNPFDPCQWSDCHPEAICSIKNSETYICECAEGYEDKDPTHPGRQCVRPDSFNQCASKETNDCSENAVCIDIPGGYKCECSPGYVDITPEGQPKGRVCIIDYCADLPFCPANTTCVIVPAIMGARCECIPGYVDIRSSPSITLFPAETYCLAKQDVDECFLGLTNCSSVAICTKEKEGYSCSCPPGYIDGNPSQPGRICAAASCSLCNDHGDCVQDLETGEMRCKCHSWFSGEHCDTDVRVVLLFIFAAVFFLLTLCCLLYFCLKCRCVRKRSLWYREPLLFPRKTFWPWAQVVPSSSSDSQAEFSAMSTPFGAPGKTSDVYPELSIPRAKLKESGGSNGEAVDTTRFRQYLDVNTSKAMKIPRARLVNEGAELDVGENAYRELHSGFIGSGRNAQVTRATSFGSEGASSEYSDSVMEEEIIRRVKTTNVKRTEIRKLATAEVHNSALTLSSESASEETANTHVHDPSSSSFGTLHSEKDRGQSIIEIVDESFTKTTSNSFSSGPPISSTKSELA